MLAFVLAILLAGGRGMAAARQPPGGADLAEARRLVDIGRIEEAIPHLERARTAGPADPAPLWMLAVAHRELGRFETGAALAGEFAALVPDSAAGPFLEGACLLALGRLGEAEAAFRRVLARDPEHAGARRELALAAARRGERTEALQELEALRGEHPTRAEILAPLGILYVQEGRTADGLGALTQAVQYDRESFEAHHHLGALYSELGQYPPAARHLETALAIRPGDPGALLERCLLRSREERLLEAKAACAEAASADPENAEGWFRSGDVLHYLSETDPAEQAYRETLRLEPGHRRAGMRLGLLLHEAGRADEAIPVLRTVVGQSPETDPLPDSDFPAGGNGARSRLSVAHLTLGRAYVTTGDLASARRSFEEAARLDPFAPEPMLHLGNLLSRGDDPEDVALGRESLGRFRELKAFSDRTNELKAAVNRNPGAAVPKRALVGHLIAGGAFAAAIGEAERLLVLGIAEPVHHLLYAEALDAAGRGEDALRAADEALADWPDHAALRELRDRLAPPR